MAHSPSPEPYATRSIGSTPSRPELKSNLLTRDIRDYGGRERTGSALLISKGSEIGTGRVNLNHSIDVPR